MIPFIISVIVFIIVTISVLFPSGLLNLTRFTKKSMIQTIYTDAWDMGAFYIGDQLYMGVSQLGSVNSFIIYRWNEKRYSVQW